MIKRWFGGKKDEVEEPEPLDFSPVTEFETAIAYAKRSISSETEKEDQLLILDYILSTIKVDIMYDLISTILYKDAYIGEHYKRPFPEICYDEKDNAIEIFKAKDAIEINLAEKHFLAIPWHKARLREKLKAISKNGFQYDKTNHEVFYFTHIELCYVESGHHSISSGIYKKQGIVKAIKCDLSKLFRHVHTDGRFWYNTHTEEILDNVWDFRIAVLYDVAKMKDDILLSTTKKG